MMTKTGKGGGGSCSSLVEYLEKEQAGLWFGHDRERLAGHEVAAEIDRNKRNLGRDDDKYYQVILAPSQAELAHIGSDPERLQAFTRAAMEQYAGNFGKGISSQDLVWFAKIEHSRSYDHNDRAVQLGEIEKGTAKPGDQTHIHVIVSRTENLQTYAEGKKNGQHERKNPLHLSPMTNHKATTKGPVVGGFERNAFAQASERAFDLITGYERSLVESFAYKHALKYGDEATKTAMRQAAVQEQAESRQAAEGPKNAPQATNTMQMVFTPIAKSNRQEAAKTDDWRQQLGAAYQKKDKTDVAAALAQVEQQRQRQEQQQRMEALKAQKAAQERETQQKQQEQLKSEKVPQIQQNRPKKGLRR